MTFLPTEVTVEGIPLYIEVTEISPPSPKMKGPIPAGIATAELMGRIELAGAAAGQTCVAIFRKMYTSVREASPEEVTIEFGLTIGGEAGLPFISKGTAEATFKISAKWDLTAKTINKQATKT